MGARDIVTSTEVFGQTPDTEGADTAVVASVITSISDAIEARTNRRIIAADYSAWHSGSQAMPHDFSTWTRCRVPQCVLYLADPSTGYATNPVNTVTSITEDGVSLNVILSTAAGPFTDGESAWVSVAEGIVRRCVVTGGRIEWTPWAIGNANIRIVYNAGWAIAAVPERIKQIAIEWILIALREGRRSGVDSYSADGSSASYGRLLMPATKDELDRFGYRDSPVTIER